MSAEYHRTRAIVTVVASRDSPSREIEGLREFLVQAYGEKVASLF